MGVVGQCLDDAALGHSAAATVPNHPLELDRQCLQARDPAFYLPKLTSCDAVDGRAGAVGLVLQIQQLSDRIQREAQFPAVADEGQAFKVFLSETPLVALGAGRVRHQADLFVVADRLDFAACPGSKFANRKILYRHGASS